MDALSFRKHVLCSRQGSDQCATAPDPLFGLIRHQGRIITIVLQYRLASARKTEKKTQQNKIKRKKTILSLIFHNYMTSGSNFNQS